MEMDASSLPSARESEWHTIINALFDGIWVADGDGRTVLVNKAYEKLTGIRIDDVIGQRAQDLVEAGVLSQSAIPGVMETLQTVTIINKVNGKRLLVTGVPVLNDEGELWRIVCSVRDITNLAELQQEIERKSALIKHYETELLKLQQIDNGPVIRSPHMIRLFESAKHVAATSSTVLILGESGVGKEVLAKWIHQMSQRVNQPYMTVNCSAIPENLIESELFGYEKGAFTGAQPTGKAGLFEMAHKGTIFLDEIGELPFAMQSKLLRVLQEKEIRRIGSGKPVPVDVRVIAATNRSLEKMVAEGTFREDLYYRINVIPFTIPPLRERKEDIPILAAHFLNEFNQIYDRDAEIGPVVLNRLMGYHWPGNVRQLKNIIERMIVLSKSKEITADDLPEFLGTAPVLQQNRDTIVPLRQARMEFEKNLIIQALKKSKSIRQTAQLLELDHSTLIRKIQQQDIDPESFLGREWSN
ncbi:MULTISPECIES: sigma-54-dependent Fis family transcriptional regulator [Paenibacillus]|uniref:sigma-54 interaction domain-containing protein n=1 Tax=Paenibacillus TaxID=44249 RepID=UPI0008900712|nr:MULTISPECIES: sigma 54-interacting transcriptional regulator [Paenibacillus]SDI34621.1 PAS domain S-box-containing protein [Paenibacillus naphthalenovorans]